MFSAVVSYKVLSLLVKCFHFLSSAFVAYQVLSFLIKCSHFHLEHSLSIKHSSLSFPIKPHKATIEKRCFTTIGNHSERVQSVALLASQVLPASRASQAIRRPLASSASSGGREEEARVVSASRARAGAPSQRAAASLASEEEAKASRRSLASYSHAAEKTRTVRSECTRCSRTPYLHVTATHHLHPAAERSSRRPTVP